MGADVSKIVAQDSKKLQMKVYYILTGNVNAQNRGLGIVVPLPRFFLFFGSKWTIFCSNFFRIQAKGGGIAQ